jgi:hypothetical protein
LETERKRDLLSKSFSLFRAALVEGTRMEVADSRLGLGALSPIGLPVLNSAMLVVQTASEPRISTLHLHTCWPSPSFTQGDALSPALILLNMASRLSVARSVTQVARSARQNHAAKLPLRSFTISAARHAVRTPPPPPNMRVSQPLN